VAIAFIDNIENKRTVNHKNGVKTDNRRHQLEWSTHSENHKHAYDVLNRVGSRTGHTGDKMHNSTPLLCLTTNRKYGSIQSAATDLKLNEASIRYHLRNKTTQIFGYSFKKLRKVNPHLIGVEDPIAALTREEQK
jgi:hypothetical protein